MNEYYLETACCCATGRVRRNNEDNFMYNGLVLDLEHTHNTEPYFLQSYEVDLPWTCGVFDGMGGEDDGETASFLAADSYKDYSKKNVMDWPSPREFLEDAISYMNEKVSQESEKRYNNMGTTAALLYFQPEMVYVCNVGDSRVFRYQEGELVQISEDHTDALFLSEKGINHRKPRLTQYVGILPEEMVVEPHIAQVELYENDVYVICSDGLTDMLQKSELSSLIQASTSCEECAEKLVAAALSAGGRDNTTVIVIRVLKKSCMEDM